MENGTERKHKIVEVRRCLYPDLNKKKSLILQQDPKTFTITGCMIQEKAIILSIEMGLDEFTASNGCLWHNRFQIHHNIKCSILSGESADVPKDVKDDWSKRLTDICSGYAAINVFNCGETGLFYRALTNWSLDEKGDSCNREKR